MRVRVRILGSGTSAGVPMPGCACATCRSTDPRDVRYRSSVLLRTDAAAVAIDTTPEFRLQMLAARADRLDAVLFTHNHADHVAGLDDVRSYTLHSRRKIPLYGTPETLHWIRQRFDYIWNAPQVGGGLPQVELVPVTAPFVAAGVPVTPIPVKHGILDIYGYRIGDFAYLADVSEIPPSSMALLRGLRTLVVDAVRYEPHATHFHVEAALQAAKELGARQTYLTHLNHELLHARLASECPPGVTPAWDGLEFDAEA